MTPEKEYSVFLVWSFSSQMSRQKDTEIRQEFPAFLRKSALFSSDLRHYFLYISGKIGLTLVSLLSSLFDALDELGQSKEIRHLKGSAASRQHDTGLRRHQARPGCWQRPYTIWSLVKSDAIFTPIVAVVEDLKLLAVQRMKGMSDRKDPFL